MKTVDILWKSVNNRWHFMNIWQQSLIFYENLSTIVELLWQSVKHQWHFMNICQTSIGFCENLSKINANLWKSVAATGLLWTISQLKLENWSSWNCIKFWGTISTDSQMQLKSEKKNEFSYISSHEYGYLLKTIAA